MISDPLNERERKIDRLQLVALAGLLFIGAAFVFSATMSNPATADKPWFAQSWFHQLIWYALGLGAGVAVCVVDYHTLARWSFCLLYTSRQRICVARVVRQIRQFKRLLAVRRDERKAIQIQVMHRLGIEAQPNAALAAERLDLVQQRLRDDALAVIADDDRVGLCQLRFHFREQAAGQLRVQSVARFAVNADDLLLVRDDAGLDAGVPRGIFHQPVACLLYTSRCV